MDDILEQVNSNMDTRMNKMEQKLGQIEAMLVK